MSDRFSGLNPLVFVVVLALASLGLPLVASATPHDVTGQVVVRANGGCFSSYVVRAGDTLSSIARRCGVSVPQLAQVNGLQLSTVIYPGQRLTIPAAIVPAAPVSAATEQANASCPPRYTVRAGDTLARIARRCGTSVAKLKLWNGLRSDVIRVGQVLVTVPISSPTRPESAATPVPRPDPSRWNAPSPFVPAAAAQAPEAVSVPEPIATPTPTPAIESPVSAW